jgi:D-ribose pyranose/furanose isomerase RbsD
MNTSKKMTGINVYLVLVLYFISSGCNDHNWRGEFSEQLALFGHRNWIIICDSAYPLQSSPGIKTINTGAEHMEVVDIVLQAIEKAPHVKPIILLDAELEKVSEEAAPGIENYKTELQKLLLGKQTKALPHEQIIAKLDQTARLFTVLILKTTMTLPYTSVFLELDCAYWNSEKEKILRDLMGQEN